MSAPREPDAEAPAPAWTFLTDHAHVLVVLARDSRIAVPDLARATGLAIPTVTAVLRDLEDAGYVRSATCAGVRYRVVDRTRPLRHPVERHHPVGRLLTAVQSPSDVLRDRLAVGGG